MAEVRDRWAETASPLSPEEAGWLFSAPPSTAPDPMSGFKLRALRVFPSRLRRLAERHVAVSIARGNAAPAITSSATAHAPKPEGGTRPLGLLPELLKRTEGLVARRVMAAAAGAPAGTLLSGFNRAYQRGVSVDPLLGIVRVIMEADLLLDLGVRWLLGDYHKWFDVVRREFVHAKLAALRVSPEVSRLVASLYERQCCRQLTHRGLSAGRFRGAGALPKDHRAAFPGLS